MWSSKCLLLSLFILITSFSFGQNRGDLISEDLLLTFDQADIEDLYMEFNLPEILFPIAYDSIEIHKLVYWTIDAHGSELIEASGLVTIPVGADCDFPLLNFNHGTLPYDQALSGLNANLQQHFVGIPFAATGYVSVLPDFLGYGETPLDHPHAYIHAKSEATAVVDMLRAARDFCSNQAVALNEQLFLVGYSHGGHVTMATHRELEEFHADEFEVTASAPGGGAYDLSGIMLDSTLYSDSFSNPFYIAFSTLTFQFVYKNIYENINDVFVPPYDSIIPLMLDRENPESFWRDSLPTPGYLMWQPDFFEALKTNPLHPFTEALRDNDVYDWVPLAPMHLNYCDGDENIPYANVTFTEEHMITLGATDITAVNVGSGLNHLDCSLPAIAAAKLWFDDFKEDCTPVAIADVMLEDRIQIYPNPVEEVLYVDVSSLESNQNIALRIYDLLGRQIYADDLDGTNNVSVPFGDLPTGTYVVRIEGGAESMSQKIIKGR